MYRKQMELMVGSALPATSFSVKEMHERFYDALVCTEYSETDCGDLLPLDSLPAIYPRRMHI